MTSHSQAGEDLIVAKCFPEGFTGNLLEIGAFHPVTFSNSRIFIEAGWSAVLCEFSPKSVRDLVEEYGWTPTCAHRKAPVQIVSAAVTVGDDAVQEFQITDDAVSTRDDGVLETWRVKGGYYGSLWVPTLPLERLLSQFFGDRKLDYASVDVEGPSVDLAIALLKTEHRPNVLVVEHDNRTTELMGVAQQLGYVAIHQNATNIILSGRW